MVQFTHLDITSDLVYKKINYEWQLTNNKKIETFENIVKDILLEDIGATIKEIITVEQLGKLKIPIEKMLSKKYSISNQLEKLIEKTQKKEESGSTIGTLIFPFLQKLIPLDLIGGQQNRFHVLTLFRKALKSGLKDKIPLKPFVEGLKTKPVRWVQSIQPSSIKPLLMAKLVKWLWKVTKSLIASKYYVTEGQGSFKLIYIPKKIWQSRTDQKLNLMIELGILKPVTEEERKLLVAKRRPAHIRWLPKKGGFLRPIISITNDPDEVRTLINKKEDSELRAFLQYLMEETKNPTRLKPQNLHRVWKSVVTKLGADRRQTAHLVTVDVKDAYGSIIQEKLVAIIKIISTMCFGSGHQDGFIQFKITKAYKRDIYSCKGLSKALVATSKGVSIVKLKDLLERVSHMVNCQTVTRTKKSYLLKKGISQAVPVSPALCDVYLSYFTITHLSEFTANKGDTLVRAVDDFLYVTPDRARAELFLKKMSVGFPSFNIHIKPEKTQSTLAGMSSIDYFGFTFDTNLRVYVKQNDGSNLTFRHTMGFTHKLTPISTLEDKMQRIPTYKLNKLTLDPDYISEKVLCWNVFYTACQMACCFKATVDTIGPDRFDKDKLLVCIQQSSQSVAAKTCKIRGKDDIFRRELYWIVVRAFFLCLNKNCSQENTFTGSLVKSLEMMENEARENVRLTLIERISSFVTYKPSQFKTGY